MDARERLRTEATHQFVERGYDGTSMQQIADACGVTKAALYYHYAGKAELLLDIVDGYLDRVASVVTAAGEASGAAAQLEAVVRGLLTLPGDSRAVMRLAMHDLQHLPDAERAAFAAAYRQRFLQPLTDIVAAGMAIGEFTRRDPTTVLWVLLGALYPFVSGRQMADEAQAVDDVIGVLLHGLTA